MFLKGIILVDVVVVVNEMIDLAKLSKNPCITSKVDFEKAYDSVSLSLLDFMLIKFDFNDK